MAILNLVGLPLGNAEDLTLRVKSTLANKRNFIVEDTRKFKQLLNFLNLPVEEYRLEPFHDHKRGLVEKYIRHLDQGVDLYIVSDAGSPIISDPAYPLVRAVLEAGHEVNTFPGQSSPIVALELSGLPPHPFSFWGFLPRKDSLKLKWFADLASEMTHICFESPQRTEGTIQLLVDHYQDFEIVIARELTKKFQEIYRFHSSGWDEVKSIVKLKGEVVLLFYKNDKDEVEVSDKKVKELAEKYLEKSSPRALAKLLATVLGKKTDEIYRELGKD